MKTPNRNKKIKARVRVVSGLDQKVKEQAKSQGMSVNEYLLSLVRKACSPGDTQPPSSEPGTQSITVPLDEPMCKALEWFRKNYLWHPTAGPESVGYLVLNIALSHPAEVSRWINGWLGYCRAEGVDQAAFIKAKISNHPEYRRIKFPT